MKGFYAALRAEALKLRKSLIFPISILSFAFIAGMMGLMAWVARHPQLLPENSLFAAKASFMTGGTWLEYLGLLSQMGAILGYLAFALAGAWIFGREYSDRTVKDLLALPVSRSAIISAKTAVVSAWSLLLMTVISAVGFAAGAAAGLKSPGPEIFSQFAAIMTVTAVLNLFMGTPVYLIASAGRGFMPPIGFILGMIILSQFLANGAAPLAPYFPWTVPGLYSVLAWSHTPLPAAAYIIVFITSAAGFAGTILWWTKADQF